jgi:hypothetical protein
MCVLPTPTKEKAEIHKRWQKSHLQLSNILFVWLVADGWYWFVLREKYYWLVAGDWFVLREKY